MAAREFRWPWASDQHILLQRLPAPRLPLARDAGVGRQNSRGDAGYIFGVEACVMEDESRLFVCSLIAYDLHVWFTPTTGVLRQDWHWRPSQRQCIRRRYMILGFSVPKHREDAGDRDGERGSGIPRASTAVSWRETLCCRQAAQLSTFAEN